MTPELVVAASALGAVCLYLLMQPRGRAVRVGAALVGLALFGWVLVNLRRAFGEPAPDIQPDPFMLAAASIVLIGAIRVVTHTRPVYCALYFILVVLASAALFLLLGAEFMAFALIIVYAGAILITYLFVLMLAQQAEAPGDVRGQADYDLSPREPGAAVIVGGLILAVLLGTIVMGAPSIPPPPLDEQRVAEAWRELERMPDQFRAAVLDVQPDFAWPPVADANGHRIRSEDGRAFVIGPVGSGSELQRVELPEAAMPSNIQRVGWALVAKFPASLELAGVILLLAMFGAVVLARRQIELGEDEKRAAAGLPRLADDEDAGPFLTGATSR
jgi:NADH-quinone oxidoreductase subunit J